MHCFKNRTKAKHNRKKSVAHIQLTLVDEDQKEQAAAVAQQKMDNFVDIQKSFQFGRECDLRCRAHLFRIVMVQPVLKQQIVCFQNEQCCNRVHAYAHSIGAGCDYQHDRTGSNDGQNNLRNWLIV